MMGWMVVLEGPCDVCADWIGVHAHSITDKGRLGNVVRLLKMDEIKHVSVAIKAMVEDGRLEIKPAQCGFFLPLSEESSWRRSMNDLIARSVEDH